MGLGGPRGIKKTTPEKTVCADPGRGRRLTVSASVLGCAAGYTPASVAGQRGRQLYQPHGDRKSTRLNSSHLVISYAVFCFKKQRAYRPFSRSLIDSVVRVVWRVKNEGL